MMEFFEIKGRQEASLFVSQLDEWKTGPQVLSYGAILICRTGRAVFRVNYKEWEMYEGAVITLFPNDVVELVVDKGKGKNPCLSQMEKQEASSPFQVEMLKYSLISIT